MNYSQYLQDGGLVQPNVEKGLKKEEVAALVLTIIKGDDQSAQEAAKALVDAYNADPENGWINDYLAGAKEAAESGNQEAARFVLLVFPLLEQAQSMKCGGKVRAKVKKACGGKMKKDKCGGKMKPKKASIGCKCTQLKKVGGRLIEVDCDENIVKHLLGGFFSNPFSSWTEFKRQFGYPIEWLYNKITPNQLRQSPKLLSAEQVQELKDNSRKGVEKMTSNLTFLELSKPKIYEGNMQIVPESSMKLTLLPELKLISPDAIIGKGNQNELPEITVIPSTIQKQTNKPYQGLFSGNLRSLQARKAWVQNNADYLKSLGWSDADITGYRGQTAAINYRLRDAINGYDAWKAQLDALASAATAVESQPETTPQVTVSEKFVKDGYNSGRPWTDAELRNMEGSSALYLNNDDWKRYLAANFSSYNPNPRPVFAGYFPGYKEGGKLNYSNYLK